VVAVNVSSGIITASIAVGASPAGIVYGAGDTYIGEDPNGYMYVANHGSTTVSVISPTTNSVVGTIIVGSRPEGVTFDPVHCDVYVSNSGSNSVSVISTSTDMVVDTVSVGASPEGITWDQDSGSVYVANANSNSVSSIAGGSADYLGDITVGSGPRALAADVGTGELYVLDGNSNQVSVVSPAASSVVIATLNIPQNYPEPIGYDSANGDVYVLDEAGDTVDVIASMGLWTNTIIAIIGVGWNPAALTVNTQFGEDGILYVANAGSNNVSVISGASNTVVASVPVGSDPRGIAYDSNNNDIYVNDEGSGTASVISGKTNTVIATIPSVNGEGEHTTAKYDPNNGEIYMCSDGSVAVINGATNTVVKSISLSGSGYSMGYDSGDGYIYVSNAGSTVWVINGATNTIATTINGPFSSSEGLTYDNTNNYLYMGDEDGGNTMWIINGATNTVVTYLNVGVLADGTVYDDVDGDNYVANEQSKTASVIATIFLTGVTISPTTSTIPTGGQQTLTATPACSGGTCPKGITYSWSMTPTTLGTLNPPSGSKTTFVAGPTAGTVSFTVTATMNNAPVTSAAVTLTIIPGLSSVISTPSSAIVFPNGYQNFTATSVCTGGACPAGTTYTWSLNNTLGTISATTGAVTLFTAGATAGPLILTLTASLNGNTAIDPINVTIVPALTAVTVTPATSVIPTSVIETFTATTVCFGGPCPSVKTYQWALNNSLGWLSKSTGPQVNFTAGNTVGVLSLTVNVTMSGITLQSSPVHITIIPGLYSVTATPGVASVPLNISKEFRANITCTGGPCPAGTIYNWSLSSSLASVNNSVGDIVDFTAGPILGNITLWVNATLDNVTVLGTPAYITIVPALVAVTVQPSPAYIAPFNSMQFVATLGCLGGPCPSGATYSWSLNNSLGTLTGHTSSTVTFKAGSTTGMAGLSLKVRLDDVSLNSSVTNITISYGPPGLMISSLGVTPFPVRVGQNMSINVGVSGGEGDYSYSYHGLPPGCTTSNVDPLVCTPLSPGNYTINVMVTDTIGDSAKASILLNILGKVKALTVELICNASSVTAGSSFQLTTIVKGGIGPFFFVWEMNSTNSTTAPNGPTWTITVNTPGLYIFQVWVTDTRGIVAGSDILNVTVQPLPQYNEQAAPPSYWWMAVVALVVSLILFVVFTRKRPGETEEEAAPVMEEPMAAVPAAVPFVVETPLPQPAPGNVVVVSALGAESGQPIGENAMVVQPEAAQILYCSFCGLPLGAGPVCANCGNVQPWAVKEPPPVVVEPTPVQKGPSPSEEALRKWMEANATVHASTPQPMPWEQPASTQAAVVQPPSAPSPPAPARPEIRGKRVCALCGFELEGTWCPQCKFDWK
jgi:YVTN family beta-propeller protein